MNNKARLKFIIFLASIIMAIPLIAVSLSLVAQFISYFQQGADPASIFRGHALVIPAPEEAEWLPIEVAEKMRPSQAEREEIIAAYWLAWDALSRAHETGDKTDLLTYWAGAAYDHATAGIRANQKLTQIHSGHRLRLTFFSADGSVVAFEDELFTLIQEINGLSVTLQASASIVMTQDQGFWRIRSITLTYV